ncbi:MAG: tRNA uracil 4-sulfurtransferase ThiI [Candidatus Paceibacterota bacterium]
MKFTHVLCHYGEIGLKGKNRNFFENILVNNIKKSLKNHEIDFIIVEKIRGRILVKLKNQKDLEKLEESLKKVFGLVNFSFAVEIDNDIKKMKDASLSLLKDKEFKSFKINTIRSYKGFSLNSQEINEKIGEYILDNLDKKVNLNNPDETVFMELTRDKSYLYTEKIKGLGGLPVSSGGRVLSLMSGGIDSPVASFLIAKRGVSINYIHFHSYPQTSKESINKVKDIVKILKEYNLGSTIYLVPFIDIQKEIVMSAPETLRIILYRRFMMRISEKIAKKEKYKALVTGDSIGQVASQTLENIESIADVVNMPIFRPLISFDKEEIITISQNIKTYKTSIKDCQDTCSWFMPKHPSTRSSIKKLSSAEAELNIDKLVEETIKSIEVIQV